MSSSPSRISVTVDFDQPGRQFGLYKIPWSDNSQPSGHIGPMAVLANGEGPTLLLTGGVHGDEYAGPVAIMRLAHELDLVRLQGRLILLPSLNTPAVQAALRCSPLDDGNLNRAFPGDPNGGPTAMIAHWLETQVLPLCDGAIDFHSGGTSSDYEPIVMVNRSPGELFARNMQLVRAFGVELVWLMGALNDNRSVNAASERAGVPMFACELGGKGESDPQMTQIAYDGCHASHGYALRSGGQRPGSASPGRSHPFRMHRHGTSWRTLRSPGIQRYRNHGRAARRMDP